MAKRNRRPPQVNGFTGTPATSAPVDEELGPDDGGFVSQALYNLAFLLACGFVRIEIGSMIAEGDVDTGELHFQISLTMSPSDWRDFN